MKIKDNSNTRIIITIESWQDLSDLLRYNYVSEELGDKLSEVIDELSHGQKFSKIYLSSQLRSRISGHSGFH